MVVVHKGLRGAYSHSPATQRHRISRTERNASTIAAFLPSFQLSRTVIGWTQDGKLTQVIVSAELARSLSLPHARLSRGMKPPACATSLHSMLCLQ